MRVAADHRGRGRDRRVSPVLLECLDALEAAVDAIERGGVEAITSDPRSSVCAPWCAMTRPLPPDIVDGSALSGAAVLSDGQIALIVDCDAVAEGVA